MLWLNVGSSESGSPRLSPTVTVPPYFALAAPAVASSRSTSAAAPRSARARREADFEPVWFVPSHEFAACAFTRV